jgi:alpha-L-fucosidase 2
LNKKQRVVFSRALIVSLLLLVSTPFFAASRSAGLSPPPAFNLKFSKPAPSWDEGIPLGNGMLGALIWERNGKLRFSLDRADLWDLRPTANLDRPEWTFGWVRSQWLQNSYHQVQELFDVPYGRDPGPSKIPAGAIEFDISTLGEPASVELHLATALCEITWKNGARLQTFIRADGLTGWFRFSGTDKTVVPLLIAPAYNLGGEQGEASPVTGQDLHRLGYPKGNVTVQDMSICYDQEGWGGFRYRVSVRWKRKAHALEGCWSISSAFPGWEIQRDAADQTDRSMKEGFSRQLRSHCTDWRHFWSQSGISLPDSILMKQWYLEMYKLKAASGNGAPPVSLQAVWTADNGKLPPWKGDFHNDLNTQLSYWPVYSSNHLTEGMGFLTWMLKNEPAFRAYTRSYFGTAGINVPGVSTFEGKPMGGWIQYAFGPTVSAWLAHHFYLQWRYSMDRTFLEKECYPWIKEVAMFFDSLSEMGGNGFRKLPLSSSPEIFDNSREAWFGEMTNFDLAFIRWTYAKAAELSGALGMKEDSVNWKKKLRQWPQFDIDPETGFTFAEGFPYASSHRHFSHLVAFHPLGLTDWSGGEVDRAIIRTTLATMDRVGPSSWCGYSYAWLGNLKARAFDAEGAATALQTFATCFCLPNSFHVNGDQSGTGKSNFTYRPFTLEGNFAFAAGVQEMLIQSHTGVIRIFPAIPSSWKEVSFTGLRAEGAFVISARMEKGQVRAVEIVSEKGGLLMLADPFAGRQIQCNIPFSSDGGILVINTVPQQHIRLSVR